MLFPALGGVTAMWLIVCPLVGIETGFRAALAVCVGLVAMVLAPLGIWYRHACWAISGLGSFLALVTFIKPPSLGGLANFATCSAALVIAGMAPQPVVELVRAAKVKHSTTSAVPNERDTKDADTVPIVSMA